MQWYQPTIVVCEEYWDFERSKFGSVGIFDGIRGIAFVMKYSSEMKII